MIINFDDTIVGIATALSNSGISIIRISGKESINIVDEIFLSVSGNKIRDSKTYTMHYGRIIDNDVVLDEVIVSLMRGPKSYTCEDVIEINCHGGVLVTKKILNLIISKGARLADPGEFTKRAFLNGRIDLSEAEAVMDVIGADSDYSLKIGLNKLSGQIKNNIDILRKTLIHEIAYIESALDDPEHISLDGYSDELMNKINDTNVILINLINSYKSGKIIKDGISTVIVGKPNAGKSSFLNYMLNEDRAIVTNIAGTTRDTIEEYIDIDGIKLRIIDTAGIRETDDFVEKIGVEKALKLADDSDLCVFIVDSSVPLDNDDIKIIDYIINKKVIVLYNKIDCDSIFTIDELKSVFSDHGADVSKINFIKMSTTEDMGKNDFNNTVKELFEIGELDSNNEIIITSLRQKELLVEANNSLNLVLNGIENNVSEDFLTIDLMNAYTSLGLIIGEEIDDDLVNEIFSSFCMGK